MMRHVKKLKMNTKDDYISCFNGSLVKNLATGEVISSSMLTGKDAKQLADTAKKLGINIHAFTPEQGLITPKNSTYTQHEADINEIAITEYDFAQLEDDAPVIKVMMIDDPKKLGDAVDKLDEQYYKDYTVVRSAPFFLEFMHKEANKGTGVKALAEHLGLDASHVIAMGDAENDHHMIQYAGLGVAMGNATEATRIKSNFITDTNVNHGVAKVIQDFILDK